VAASLRLFRILLRFALPAAWAWFIFWVSSEPVPPGTGADGGFLDFLPRPDLVAHFGVYAIFGWLVMLSLLPIKLCKPINVALHFAMPVIIAGVYGIAMEWVQDGIPERSAEALDVIADIVGAIAAVAVMTYLWPKIKRLGHAIAA
jgi:VanZ family protein